MKAKHYFAAGNTASGFINCFNYINDSVADAHLFILKGGPGTGKSTLMKKIGRHFEEKGVCVEYFYCASDPESLDGVRIVSANAAVVDGTAPHVTEASLPGITDEIVNIGTFIGRGIRTHKTEIENLLEEKKRRVQSAEHYLRAAGEAYQAENTARTPDLINAEACGRVLFLSALGKNLTGFNNYKKTLTFKESGADEICMLLDKRGKTGGIFFPSLLDPVKPEALEIGGTLIRFPSPVCAPADELLRLAEKTLEAARVIHKQIESFYIPHMDFAGLDRTAEELIRDIESRI